MKVLKPAIVILVLLSIAMLNGCQGGYARQSNSTETERVAFEPSGTGFWKPKTAY
ncbi:MAG: hypothetical protein ACYSUX_03655 [Planctomycetota bacterium]